MATTDDQRQTFLDEMARTGVIADACRAAQIRYSTYRRWLQDEEFAEAFEDAKQEAADALESEARRRAIEGVTRAKVIGSGDNAMFIEEQQYSDTLLLALLKAHKPDKFADRSKTEITSPDDAFKPNDPTQAAARLASILEEARKRKERGEKLDPSDDLFS